MIPIWIGMVSRRPPEFEIKKDGTDTHTRTHKKKKGADGYHIRLSIIRHPSGRPTLAIEFEKKMWNNQRKIQAKIESHSP